MLPATIVPSMNVLFNSVAVANSPPGFTPTMHTLLDMDKNYNGIEDGLDHEIAERLSNGTVHAFVNVTVMLTTEPTAYDVGVFVSSGGYLTTSLWTYAVYGFGGRIPYDGIGVFAKQCPDALLVEKEAIGHSSLAYAAQQVGARPYVWSTLGLQGDPNSSIAIVDTGIDASQSDFSPGFGSQNFSEKIVGWNNQVNAIATPYDDNGHGSHVSGLAAGDGFFSVDASGYATATWGTNLGSVSNPGTYLISGMMVNRTGTITINVKWATTGRAKLSALPLYYGGKTLASSSWAQVATVSTPSQNTWYNLTYNVASTPSGSYDMYHVLMSLARGSGNLYVVFTVSWPYTPPSDGFSAWTGMAPQAKLVGVKVLDSSGSGTSTGLINGMNWIIANRITYHITVASMSLGFGSEVSSVDSAVRSLVNSGVTTVVAAGNSGSGSNYVYTPGSVDEVITVAAMNQFDDITSYSSQGGTSRYAGQTVKSDITAPGGSFYAVPLFSADSNYNDGEGEWVDVQANDSAPMQGTSMATPVVAGAVNIVQQALGGYNAWSWTRSQALMPKMILLMTATETYPNLREGSTSAYSPTLNRGGKDVQEGYGRLNLDAAVDAILKTYQVGTTVSDTLGAPPTLDDISALGQKLAWARNVQLVSGIEYNFTLSVPSGADHDLYLYNSTGTGYGEPVILAKSTKAMLGGFENITYTPALTGEYYIVIKRATENTGTGMFTLSSQAPSNITYLVVRGENDEVFYRAYSATSGSWTSWNLLPGATSDSPAAAVVGNQLHVVGRGVTSDQIWYGYVNLTNNVFSGWMLLSGATPSAPALTANSTTLCLVVRGESDVVWYRFYDITSKIWSEWTSVPDGATSDGPAAALLDGTLQVIVRGVSSDQVWHCYVSLTDNTFSGWMPLSGATPSAPTLTTNGTSLNLVVRGESNVIWYRGYNITAKVWGDWAALPNGATIDGPAAAFMGNQLQVVVRGVTDDQVWHGFVNLADSTFGGWTPLDGATPSKPTLVS
jgi:subtilisin family serine protease